MRTTKYSWPTNFCWPCPAHKWHVKEASRHLISLRVVSGAKCERNIWKPSCWWQQRRRSSWDWTRMMWLIEWQRKANYCATCYCNYIKVKHLFFMFWLSYTIMFCGSVMFMFLLVADDLRRQTWPLSVKIARASFWCQSATGYITASEFIKLRAENGHLFTGVKHFTAVGWK